MAQCTACRAEIPVYERRCQSCGAGVVRDANSLLANAPTDKELSQARLCHLLALPGMLIMAIYFGKAPEKFRSLGVTAAEPAYPVLVLVAASKVAVCTQSWRRGVQLPASLDAGDLRRMVRSVWRRTGKWFRVDAGACGGIGRRHRAGLGCIKRCSERGGRQVSG